MKIQRGIRVTVSSVGNVIATIIIGGDVLVSSVTARTTLLSGIRIAWIQRTARKLTRDYMLESCVRTVGVPQVFIYLHMTPQAIMSSYNATQG